MFYIIRINILCGVFSTRSYDFSLYQKVTPKTTEKNLLTTVKRRMTRLGFGADDYTIISVERGR